MGNTFVHDIDRFIKHVCYVYMYFFSAQNTFAFHLYVIDMHNVLAQNVNLASYLDDKSHSVKYE